MPNGLLIGRWQTLHEGHDWLVEQVEARDLKPIMAIRDTVIDESNPLTAAERIQNITERYGDRVEIIVIPDIKAMFYGRDVGYEVTELSPPDDIKKISGSAIRAKNKNKKVARKRTCLPIIYTLHVIVIQSIFFYLLTHNWRWAIETSIAWNVINTLVYCNYRYWLARLIKMGMNNGCNLANRK